MLSFKASEVRYEPYPLFVLRPAMDPALYDQLSATFPDASLFTTLDNYHKQTLSEKYNPENYHRFIEENPVWKRFHAWIKSDAFIRQVVDFLGANHVDLELKRCFEPAARRFKRELKHGKFPTRPPRLTSRFEFSSLKADGGEVAPHTDTPKKIITLVLSMIRDGEWDPSFGGNLDVNRTSDPAFAFNFTDRQVPWESVEVIESIPFVPNQCMVFVKTFNSLHSVRKMTQTGSTALRKTVTIVIEKRDN